MAEKRKSSVANENVNDDVASKKPRRSIDGSKPAKLTGSNNLAVRPVWTGEDEALATHFQDLASEDSDTRIKAAAALLTLLHPSKEPSPRIVDKALRRLIRGLCSNRKAARHGFSTALSELLNLLYGPDNNIKGASSPLPGTDIVPCILEQTQPTLEGESQEKRDTLLGRVFGLNAVLVSNVDLEAGQWATIIDHIIELANTSPVLREQCCSVLCDAVGRCNSASGSNVQELIAKVVAGKLAKTPEGVAIWLQARAKFGDDVLPKDVWHQKDPLCSKERSTLAKVMQGNFDETAAEDTAKKTSKKSQTGYRRQKPSFAWNIVLGSARSEASGKEKKADKTAPFDKLWNDLVDNTLFASTASPERKSWGLQLFVNALQNMPQIALAALFSPQLMTCIKNQSKNDGSLLHSAAVAALDAVQARAKHEPSSAGDLVQALTGKHGLAAFRTTVEGLLLQLDDDAILNCLDPFLQTFNRPHVDAGLDVNTRAAIERRTVLDILVKLVQKKAETGLQPAPSKSWPFVTLKLLARWSYFTLPEGVAIPAMADKTQETCKERLESCYAYLVSSNNAHAKSNAIELVNMLPQLAEGMIFKLDEQAASALRKAHKKLLRLKEKEKKAKSVEKKDSLCALQLLWAMTILQVYSAETDAASLLEELSDSSKAIIDGDDDEAGSFDVLFEILLSFSAKPSKLFAKLSSTVFTTFASHLTEGSLQSILDILAKSEDLGGQQDLFDQDASDFDAASGGSDNEDEEDASDVELVEDDDEAEDDDADEDVDEDENDESDAGDDGEAADFEAKLALALGTSRAKADGDDAEDSTSDDSDMDDDQMMALEPALTQIFVQRKALATPKREREDAKKTMIIFKGRVLGLLEIFIKTQTSSPLALQMLVPLLELIKSTTDKSLLHRADALIRLYSKKCRGDSIPKDVSKSELLTLLRDIHEQAMVKNGVKPFRSKEASTMFKNDCLVANFVVCRLLTGMKAKYLADVYKVFQNTCKEGEKDEKRDVGKEFRDQWMNWYNNMTKKAAQ